MYPSGAWRGFWQQEHYGRQAMEQFEMRFQASEVRGRGFDVIGPFTIHGTCDAHGHIGFVKQYVGKHAVVYRGQPDGEGSILGQWTIDAGDYGTQYTGSFLLQPVRTRSHEELPIQELTRPQSRHGKE